MYLDNKKINIDKTKTILLRNTFINYHKIYDFKNRCFHMDMPVLADRKNSCSSAVWTLGIV